MTQPGTNPDALGLRMPATVAATFLTQAFVWMTAGLLVTAGIAAVVWNDERLLGAAAGLFLPLIIGQLALVFAIGFLIRRISATVAIGLFFLYAASMGLTVGLIVSLYTGASVATAFLSAAAMFGGAALYGATTKRSLAGLGGALVMGLIGLVAASLVNLFLASDGLGWALSLGGVVLFTVLTAYDVQRIGSGAFVVATGSVEKAAVYAALELYLDAVNLFLSLLRLFGDRR
jgi:hypothetical protein